MRLVVACRLHLLREILFAGSAIDEWGQSVRCQGPGDSAVTFGRPLFGAPSGAGGEDDEVFFYAKVCQLLRDVCSGLIIVRKLDRWQGQTSSCDCFGERMILL